MPNTAQDQVNFNIQITGVEISTGNSILNQLLTITFPKATAAFLNAEYFTGAGINAFEIGSSGTVYPINFVLLAHKGAANSITVKYSGFNTQTQFLVGPGGIWLYACPVSGGNLAGTLLLDTGVNIVPIEIITGTVS